MKILIILLLLYIMTHQYSNKDTASQKYYFDLTDTIGGRPVVKSTHNDSTIQLTLAPTLCKSKGAKGSKGSKIPKLSSDKMFNCLQPYWGGKCV